MSFLIELPEELRSLIFRNLGISDIMALFEASRHMHQSLIPYIRLHCNHMLVPVLQRRPPYSQRLVMTVVSAMVEAEPIMLSQHGSQDLNNTKPIFRDIFCHDQFSPQPWSLASVWADHVRCNPTSIECPLWHLSPLEVAACTGNFEAMDKFKEASYSASRALPLALLHGKENTAIRIISDEIRSSRGQKQLWLRWPTPQPLLHFALTNKCYHVSEYLMSCDKTIYSINDTDSSGNTALMNAIMQEVDVSVVEEIVSLGCNVDTPGCCKRTPLHRAIELGLWDIVEYLLRNGASPYPPSNHFGRVPISPCSNCGGVSDEIPPIDTINMLESSPILYLDEMEDYGTNCFDALLSRILLTPRACFASRFLHIKLPMPRVEDVMIEKLLQMRQMTERQTIYFFWSQYKEGLKFFLRKLAKDRRLECRRPRVSNVDFYTSEFLATIELLPDDRVADLIHSTRTLHWTREVLQISLGESPLAIH